MDGATGAAPVAGHVAAGYEAVEWQFRELFESARETGAALAVIHRGELVVDLRGGWSDAARTTPWVADTIVNTFSVGKAVAALALLMVVERHGVGLDDKVSVYWPEYGASGKAATTLRHLLSHQAGMAGFPEARPLEAWFDWNSLTADLAAGRPEWQPGTAVGEHALTYGHLVGEVVRRVEGRSIGRFIADEIALPWRLDLYVGLDAAARARAAELEYSDTGWPATVAGAKGSLRRRALTSPAGWLDLNLLNSAAWRRSEVPAVNLHGSAVALARLYAGLLAGGVLDGVRLLRPGAVAEMLTVQVEGPDLVLGRTARWALGVQVDDSGEWGMGGTGGCDAFASPKRGYSYAYVTRCLGDHERSAELIVALDGVIDRWQPGESA